MKQELLVKRLMKIRKRYSDLVDSIADLDDEDVKKKYLELEAILNDESEQLKRYLNLLVDDPCPIAGYPNSCSGCPHEQEHVAQGIITPNPKNFFEREELND